MENVKAYITAAPIGELIVDPSEHKEWYGAAKNMSELVSTAARFGMHTFPIGERSISDIVDHTPAETLTELATNKKEVFGEQVREITFAILAKVWGLDDAIEFYNNAQSNFTEHIAGCACGMPTATQQNMQIDTSLLETRLRELEDDNRHEHCKRISAKLALKNAIKENTILKAKLYDLLTKDQTMCYEG